jgi:hypothetical protein
MQILRDVSKDGYSVYTIPYYGHKITITDKLYCHVLSDNTRDLNLQSDLLSS